MSLPITFWTDVHTGCWNLLKRFYLIRNTRSCFHSCSVQLKVFPGRRAIYAAQNKEIYIISSFNWIALFNGENLFLILISYIVSQTVRFVQLYYYETSNLSAKVSFRIHVVLNREKRFLIDTYIHMVYDKVSDFTLIPCWINWIWIFAKMRRTFLIYIFVFVYGDWILTSYIVYTD
jgi:hypothetical protein